MLGEVGHRDLAESMAMPVEGVVDRITTNGTVELEFCFGGRLGVLGAYIPHLSGKSPRFAYWSPRDAVLGRECCSYLRQRCRELLSDPELAAWAVKHRWPNPERFVPGAVGELVETAPVSDAAVLDAIIEGGKNDPRTAFLFNLNVVVWDPIHREFCFPDIPDYPTANACREYLRRSGLALNDYPEKRPGLVSDPFATLIEYAESHHWPEVNALATRAMLWRAIRHPSREVRIVAIGEKDRNRLLVGGEEVTL